MSAEFEDEITSINAIYGGDTLVQVSQAPRISTLTFPTQTAISLRIEFPSDYPDAPPSILGTQATGEHVAKGEGTYFVELVREVLAEIYAPGAPCIFDLIEEVGSRLQQLDIVSSSRSAEQPTSETNGQPQAQGSSDEVYSDAHQPIEPLGQEPPWALSPVIAEKKSVFVARAAPVTSVDQAKRYLAHLIATDKKMAKATHNITAWRIRGENGVQYQDCDDDGETAAGGRLLHLLELMGIWNAMVVVTRWYGGVHLGPDRFRIINQAARDSLVTGGFVVDGAKDGSKKKGKK